MEEAMKQILFLFASFFLAASASSAQRLPQIAIPESYQLSLAPDFSNNTFAGEETIQVRVLKPTDEIVLHAKDINFQSISITNAGISQEAKVTLVPESQMARLATGANLQPGPATIHIQYTGALNDELRGFYIGKDDQGRKYAATQLEDTDARRAFPCFDEPSFKATFEITVVTEKDMTVISNGRVVSDSPGPGGAKHTVRFSTTPRMSSYLVAVVVGHFESIQGEADGIPIRVLTTPGKKALAAFALEAAKFNLSFYDRYFGIKYPYGKLDLVGLEDFSAGAMENTGCILFRDYLLLLDEKSATTDLKKLVATVIAHEMAHQWFGDLVTMKWWDDKWLNEGFATWMSSKPIAAWKPDWNIQLYTLRRTLNAFDEDALVNTHPIHQPADTPAQILELDDAITYDKTAAVLGMMESYLGPESFRAGVNSYLKQHSYANAASSDFWNAETQVSGKPVDKIMASWIEQAGLPLLVVKTKCQDKFERIELEQERYFYDRSKLSAGSPELWQIPLCIKAPASGKPEACELLVKKQQSFTLQGCAPWDFVNANAKGFYHSGYSPEAIRSIAEVAENALTPGERLTLLSDVWASVAVDREPIDDFMVLAEGLTTETSSMVLEQVVKQLRYVQDYLVSVSDREAFDHWVRQLLAEAVREVGWEPKPGESEARRTLRAELITALGSIAEDPEVLARAQMLASQYLRDPDSIDREIAPIALRVAARRGDEAFYEELMKNVLAAKTPETYINGIIALSSFQEPRLVERTLEYAISPQMRSQDAVGLISFLMQNPAVAKQAWDFVQAHWSVIENLGGAFAGGEIVQATSGFCDPAMRDEVETFFTTHPAPAAERSLKQSAERINYCVDLKARQSDRLAAWLQNRRTSASK
jgi:aminopeptidase N